MPPPSGVNETTLYHLKFSIQKAVSLFPASTAPIFFSPGGSKGNRAKPLLCSADNSSDQSRTLFPAAKAHHRVLYGLARRLEAQTACSEHSEFVSHPFESAEQKRPVPPVQGALWAPRKKQGSLQSYNSVPSLSPFTERRALPAKLGRALAD